jgi:uncharacterized protein YheU (UPF0270 family)
MIATMQSTSSAVGVEEEKEVDEGESPEGIENLIQDLVHSDNARVNAALDALNQDLEKNKEKCDTVIVWGGCVALVRLLRDRIKKAMKEVPQCDQVTESHELPELPELETF